MHDSLQHQKQFCKKVLGMCCPQKTQMCATFERGGRVDMRRCGEVLQVSCGNIVQQFVKQGGLGFCCSGERFPLSVQPLRLIANNEWPRSMRGFTLIELLLIVSIIALLSTFVTWNYAGVAQLSYASNLVCDQLDLARQSALSLNRAVEVRFYQFSDPQNGEQGAEPASGQYRAMQLFEISDFGSSAVALGKMERLPTNVIIDSRVELSSIIGYAQPAPATPTATNGALLNVAIPGVHLNYNVVAFRFLPDGSAKLAASNGLNASNRWFLTLRAMNGTDAKKVPPPNFVTIQIQPLNGHVHTFRP